MLSCPSTLRAWGFRSPCLRWWSGNRDARKLLHEHLAFSKGSKTSDRSQDTPNSHKARTRCCSHRNNIQKRTQRKMPIVFTVAISESFLGLVLLFILGTGLDSGSDKGWRFIVVCIPSMPSSPSYTFPIRIEDFPHDSSNSFAKRDTSHLTLAGHTRRPWIQCSISNQSTVDRSGYNWLEINTETGVLNTHPAKSTFLQRLKI